MKKKNLNRIVISCIILMLWSKAHGQNVVNLPSIYSIHRDYFSDAKEIENLKEQAFQKGIFNVSGGQNITLSGCSAVTKPEVIIWTEEEILEFVKKLGSAISSRKKEKIIHDLKKIIFMRKLAASNYRLKIHGPSHWATYARDKDLGNVIKAFSLFKAGFHKNRNEENSYQDFVSSKIPLTAIMLPTKLVYKKLGVGQGQLTSKINGWSTSPVLKGNRYSAYYIVLTQNSRKRILGKELISSTLPHEVAHYLGIPHIFFGDGDLVKHSGNQSQQGKIINTVIKDKDCGIAKFFNGTDIRDFDYLKSGNSVSDTIPVFLSRKQRKLAQTINSRCLTEYSKLSINGLVDPESNLMMYGRKPPYLLSLKQFEKSVSDLTKLVGDTSTNLCN